MKKENQNERDSRGTQESVQTSIHKVRISEGNDNSIQNFKGLFQGWKA